MNRFTAVALSSTVIACAACSARHTTAATHTPAMAAPFERQVNNAVDLGEGDVQIRALRAEVIAHPENLIARLQLADRYWKTGAVELAVDHYRLAAAQHLASPRVAMLLARALRDQNRPEEAISVLTAFGDRNPSPAPELLSLLGILNDDNGRLAAGEAAYRASILADPRRADVHNNLGYNLLLQGKSAEAVAEFQAALDIEPRSEFAHNNLGLALLAQWKDDSQPANALLHWQSVADPASAHNNLATVLMEQKRYSEARKELEIALTYRKDHAAAWNNFRLIATLDGGPAVPPAATRNLFWKRVRNLFHKDLPKNSVEAAKKS